MSEIEDKLDSITEKLDHLIDRKRDVKGPSWKPGGPVYRQIRADVDHDHKRAGGLCAQAALDASGNPASILTVNYKIFRFLTRDETIRVATQLIDSLDQQEK